MVLELIRSTQKDILIARSIGVALMIQSLISMPIWIGNGGLFPMVPVFDSFLLEISPSVQFFWGILYFGLLISLILSPRKYLKKSIITFVFVFLLMVLQDINRLQVWNYLFIIILLIIFFCSKFEDSDILIYLRYILGGVYFWSGIHKLNIHYFEVFQWMTSEIPMLKEWALPLFSKVSAFVEIFIGICLIAKYNKKVVFVAVFCLHIFILISLISLNWNEVVYAWNIEMVFLVYLSLFIPQDKNHIFTSNILYFIIFIIGLFPGLFLWDLIPGCFSFCMYSGREMTGTILFHSKDVTVFPNSLNIPIPDSQRNEPIGIDIDYWCVKINHVPAFADEKIYLKLSKILCKQYSQKNYGGIILTKYPKTSPPIDKIYPCE